MSENDEHASEEFLARFRARDPDAIRSLFERHGNAVERVVKKILGEKPRQRFEDSVQSIWLAAIEGAPGFEGNSRISTWILSIARNYCLAQIRGKKGRRTGQLQTDEANEPAEKNDSVPEQVEARTLGTEAQAMLASLPAESVTEFLDYYIEKKSCAEIGAARSIHPNTVRQRILKVLAKLRERLTPLELASGDFDDDRLR
jgi:RNA polymerase sigma-70 factor (ECF subfamily)